jgi:hypothetical protein
MKKILLLCIFFSASAVAKDVAVMPNRAGGGVVLTNEDCYLKGKNYEGLKRSYAVANGGQTIDGCFYLENDFVVLGYEDGTKYRYPIAQFQLLEKDHQSGHKTDPSDKDSKNYM